MRPTDRAYRDLERLWYNKLKESGFDDIEDSRGERPLKSWHSTLFQNYGSEQFRAKQLYFECARALIHTHKISTQIEKRIWALHSEGVSIREIMLRVKKSFWMVRHTIEQVAREIK